MNKFFEFIFFVSYLIVNFFVGLVVLSIIYPLKLITYITLIGIKTTGNGKKFVKKDDKQNKEVQNTK